MRSRGKKGKPIIHGSLRVGEIVALLPEAESLLAEYGFHCSGCAMGGMETLEDGCQMHGFSQEDTEDLLIDLNTLLQSQLRLHSSRNA
ncbi:DUF1858 domain-containing protein [Candidatus Peregrinibacteria bacterium]|nr:DUF1858 domain-containing protein [Candidatus Peregrinibacteria bacterium]